MSKTVKDILDDKKSKKGLKNIDLKFNNVLSVLNETAPHKDNIDQLKQARTALTEIIHELVNV